uniref:TMV resistance protein N-like n=1 Tax=Erigeron canadensis TaxID=72917 RepID=UPI001CB8F14A|nr:TMV resistance protein N-like [Erigeron canadensis]
MSFLRAACMDPFLASLPRTSTVRIVFRHVREFIAKSLSSSSSCSDTNTIPTRRCWTYDVFLNFHGKDTRNNFVSHLYAALEQAGSRTFKDDKKLPKGKPISLELMKAIQESRIHVVILSKHYANSTWCLDELAEIIIGGHHCQNNATPVRQKVLPVFYHVDPSDVRDQKGTFHAAFKRHQVKYKNDVEKVKRWRKALQMAADISGWHVSKTASGYVIHQFVPPPFAGHPNSA